MSITNLPKPQVLETLSFEALLTERKDRLLSLARAHYQTTGEHDKLDSLTQALELESEPMVKLLQESAYREILMRQRVNDAARAVMLPLAGGSDLDNLGALYGVYRSKAADQTLESDEPFRQRLLLAPKSLSTAGSKAAYKFHALSAGNLADKIEVQSASDVELQVSYRYASQKNLVKDATVESPEPCVVNVNVLGFDTYGQLDSHAIMQITEHLSGDRIRPLGDRITVHPADIVLYQWQFTLNLTPELEGSAQVEVIVQQVREQLVQFVQRHHYLGKAIRHSTLLGTISPLIEGWTELTLFSNGQALAEGQDLLIENHQAGHLDLSAAPANLSWLQRLEHTVEQSITVRFDG